MAHTLRTSAPPLPALPPLLTYPLRASALCIVHRPSCFEPDWAAPPINERNGKTLLANRPQPTMSMKTETAQQASPSSSGTNSHGNTPAPTAGGASAAGAAQTDENLVCRWNQCGERFAAPEILYVSTSTILYLFLSPPLSMLLIQPAPCRSTSVTSMLAARAPTT